MLANSNFLYPKSHYYGEVKPENLVFDANLQEFSQRVSYISSLASNGKITLDEAFDKIDRLWKQLEESKEQLGLGNNPFGN